ncbi:MAG: hypothetical protein HFG22_16905 [Lachnospiraceae bacterium]|nr:hypothetical protein [Lachnospiraceae bacterium]
MDRKWKAASAAAIAGLMLFGCKRYLPEEKVFTPEVSSIYVTEDGRIFSATVEDCETDRYTSEGLEAFVMEEVARYNESLGYPAAAVEEQDREGSGRGSRDQGDGDLGGGDRESGDRKGSDRRNRDREDRAREQEQSLPVTVVSCQVTEGKATAIYGYLDSASFLAFAESFHDEANRLRSLGIGSASSGRVQGWFEDGEYVEPGPNGGVQTAKKEELDRLNKERMLLVETSHPVTIQTEGEICYMTQGVELSGDDVAVVPAGKHYIVFK